VLTEDDLRAVLSKVGVDAPVRALEVTASTNTTALDMARDGAPPWTLVTAAHQTAGRGREGRPWLDMAGGALLCSVLVPPEPPWQLLSLLAGASMADAIRQVARVDARCTWPNDVLVDGAKVCGILLESIVEDDRVTALVVGAGVNLLAPPVEGAGALGDVDVRALLVAFLRGMREDLGEPERIRSRWIATNDTIGRAIASGADGAVASGRAVGITDDGDLLIDMGGGRLTTLSSGEIQHVR
jgi:BirA family biotin operon repressor/biotin-[acetyl-CoA-carboxylase] ligase